MEPYIRNYNYFQNYYDTVYDIYSEHYPAYPIIYYSISWGDSIYDKGTLDAGTYEKNGVGELTGIKFKKILFLPVYGIEQVQPTYNADEKGHNMFESERTQVIIPSNYGLVPGEWDVVHFIQDFTSPENFENGPIFVVHNVNTATMGNLTHYQCKLKAAPYSLQYVKDQVTSYYMFVDLTKRIHRLDTAHIMNKLQQRSGTITDRLSSLFDCCTGFYLKEG